MFFTAWLTKVSASQYLTGCPLHPSIDRCRHFKWKCWRMSKQLCVAIFSKWLVGLGVWFSLWVREVPGSNPGRAQLFVFARKMNKKGNLTKKLPFCRLFLHLTYVENDQAHSRLINETCFCASVISWYVKGFHSVSKASAADHFQQITFVSHQTLLTFGLQLGESSREALPHPRET